MSNLSAVTTFAPVEIWESFSGPAAEAITKGQFVRLNTTTGKVELGNNTSVAECRFGGLAMSTVGAGHAVDVMARGYADCGNVFSSMNYDADVYVGTTDGLMADATSGSSSTPIGRVFPAFGHTTADKLIRLEM